MNCLRLKTLVKIISVAALAAALQACSTVKLVYNQTPEVAWWYVSDYLDFTDAQRPQIRRALTELHSAHRRQQLPAYGELLQRWQPVLARDVTPAQTCALYTEVVTLVVGLADLTEQLPADALTTLARLSEAQIAGLARSYTKANLTYREDYLQGAPSALRDKRFKQALSRAESLYGSLDDRQKNVLQTGIDRLAFDGEAAYARRLKRQQEVLQTLRTLSSTGTPLEQARSTLRTLMAQALGSFDPANRQDMASRQRSCQLMAELHNSTDANQRQKAANTFARYAADVRALVREP